jgi:tetratricopeptide (TPR) repeat protein
MFPLQPLQEATPIRWAGGGVPLSPRGTSRRSKDGDHSVAIEQYTLALQLFKKLAELESDRKTEAKGLCMATLSLRGDSYKAKREFEIALADYNMALELRSENVQAYMGRADLYESMGERERAIADYQKALAVGPNMLA